MVQSKGCEWEQLNPHLFRNYLSPQRGESDNSSWLSLYIVGISFSISQALILEDTATLSPTWVWHPVGPFILEDESAGDDQKESETSPPGLEAVVALLCNRQDTDAWPFGLENAGTQSQTKSMCVGRRLGLLIARIRE